MRKILHDLVSVWHRTRRLFGRRRLEREIDEEVAFHLAMRREEHAREGVRDADLVARRQFGNVTVIREEVRDMWKLPSIESVWQDMRYALRTLWRSPVFAITAVLVLAIGIGANAAIYSLVHGVFVRGLPYPDADRLVMLIGNVERATGVERRGNSYPDFLDWRAQATHIESMAAWQQSTSTLFGTEEPERINIEFASAAYFPIFGLNAQKGRFYGPDEDLVANRDLVVVLSDGLWKRRFGADPAIVNKTVTFGTRPFTVVGVAPPGFRGLSDSAEVWLPFALAGGLDARGSRGFFAVARMKDGTTIEQTRSELDRISANLARQYPDTNEKRAVEVSPLQVEVFGQLRDVLRALMVAVLLVLLIACTNVANLLIGRSEARQREIAVRTALGAGRARLTRQLITESTVLAVISAIAGLALGAAAIRLLISTSPIALPSFIQPGLSVPVLVYALVLTVGCGLLMGLAPLVHVRTGRLADSLRESARGSAGRRSQRLRSALVVAEVALAVILLAGAGLMIRSMLRLTAIDPGFDTSSVLSMSINIPTVPPPPAQPGAQGPPPAPQLSVPTMEVLERARAVAGVVEASLASDVPLGPNASAVFYSAEGDDTASAQTIPRAFVHRTTGEFFATLGMPIRSGRTFTTADYSQDSPAVIVSANVIKRFWNGQDPIGKRIKLGGPASQSPWLTIVGVVDEVKYRALPQNPTADPDLYLPYIPCCRPVTSVLVKTSVPPASVTESLRSALRALHPSLVVYNVATLADSASAQTQTSRFTAWLLGVFAATALALAVIGIYGVMAYLVTQRTREFGIRLALGATRREIVGLVFGHGARMVALGLVIGIAGAFAVLRLLGSLLFEVTTTDVSGVIAVLAIAGVALAACIVPAIRATRVNPVTALRTD